MPGYQLLSSSFSYLFLNKIKLSPFIIDNLYLVTIYSYFTLFFFLIISEFNLFGYSRVFFTIQNTELIDNFTDIISLNNFLNLSDQILK